LYRWHYRIAAWRYRIGAWRYRRRLARQFPENAPHVDPPTTKHDVALLPPGTDLERGWNHAQPSRVIEDDSLRDQTYLVMERLGAWIVRHDDVEIASRGNRTEALTVAVLYAYEDQPSEVVILGQDGAIEEKCAFGD
jgi:hypothetical protein